MEENEQEEKNSQDGYEEFLEDYVSPENEPDSSQEGATPDGQSKKIDISKAFSGSLPNKLRILSEAIEEVNQLIVLRKAISQVIQDRVDKEIFNSETLLLQVKPWQLGHNQSIEMRRLGLEREILSLRKEKRGEDVKVWEHVSSLMKLRRQFVIEYENLLNTKKSLEGSAP